MLFIKNQSEFPMINVIGTIYPLIKNDMLKIMESVDKKVAEVQKREDFLNHDNKLNFMQHSIKGSIVNNIHNLFNIERPLKTWIYLNEHYSLPLYDFYKEIANEIVDVMVDSMFPTSL
jgi:3-dehydroquinate dehydratase